MNSPKSLAVSEWGRLIVWVSSCSMYNGQVTNYCIFSNKEEAIAYAKFNAAGFMDWSNFPDPKKQYPYDDRDGTEEPNLTPVFVATWEGGKVEVVRNEICDVFDWGAKNAPIS